MTVTATSGNGPVDVLLLTPPTTSAVNPAHHPRAIRSAGAYPPLGLACLAGELKAAGIAVRILDLKVQPRPFPTLTKTLQSLRPRVVGIGAMTLDLPAVSELSARVRQALPDSLIVVGGPCLEDYPEEVLTRLGQTDLCVRGEGELTFREVVERYLAGSTVEGLAGTVFRDHERRVRRAPERPLVERLDSLARPAYHLIDFARYAPAVARGSRYATMYTTRGCPFRCTYCHRQSWLTSVRNHSPERVAEDVRHLISDLGVEEIKFYDETFTLDRRWVLDLCARLGELQASVPWEIRTRPELLDQKLVGALKAAGCYRVCIGVEGGSEERLRRMGRPVPLDAVRTAFRLAHEAGLSTLAFFMLGFPGDSRQDYRDVRRLLAELGPTWVVLAITTAYANTAIYQELLASGRLTRDVWRDFTLGRCSTVEVADVTFDGLDYPRRELEAMVKRAYVGYYLGWRPALRILREVRSVRQLGSFARLALGLGQTMFEPWGSQG